MEPSPACASVTCASATCACAAPDRLPPTPAGPSPVMVLLQQHQPLTLLLDLAWGVRSQEVYDAEPGDLSWLRPDVA